jgi:hypothetical protein
LTSGLTKINIAFNLIYFIFSWVDQLKI